MNTEAKRVALIANSTWNVYNFRLNVVRALLNEHYNVYIIAPIDEYIEYIDQYPTVTHIPLKFLSRDGISPMRNFQLINELKTIIKHYSIDFVISYTHKPNIFGALALPKSVPSIAVITGLGYSFLHSKWLRRLIIALYKWTGRKHKLFVFENQDDKAYFIQQGIIDASKAKSIKGCGVDLKHFSPVSRNYESKIVFTYVGRLLYDKGIREFYEAAKNLRSQYTASEVECWILGELDPHNPATIEKNELVQWIESGVIKYLGFKRDVRKIIADSSCIVLPSYREGMPRINMEAAAMATPVITTDVPGCRETILPDESGFLVAAQDSHALHKAMEKFALLPVAMKMEMGKKGRRFADLHFDAHKIALTYVSMVQSLMPKYAKSTLH